MKLRHLRKKRTRSHRGIKKERVTLPNLFQNLLIASVFNFGEEAKCLSTPYTHHQPDFLRLHIEEAIAIKQLKPTLEGYRPLGITINHWQPTATAEKEMLPSKITTAKESEAITPLLRCLDLEHPNPLTHSKQNSPIHARHF